MGAYNIPENNKISDILANVPGSVNPSGIVGGYNASSTFVPFSQTAYTIPIGARTFNVNTTATAESSFAATTTATSYTEFLSSGTEGTYFETASLNISGTSQQSVITTVRTYLIGWWGFTGSSA